MKISENYSVPVDYISKENVFYRFDPAEFKEYRKTVTTRMIYVDGSFKVKTLEGILECNNGWLALDADNNPYPLDADIQKISYEEVKKWIPKF